VEDYDSQWATAINYYLNQRFCFAFALELALNSGDETRAGEQNPEFQLRTQHKYRESASIPPITKTEQNQPDHEETRCKKT